MWLHFISHIPIGNKEKAHTVYAAYLQFHRTRTFHNDIFALLYGRGSRTTFCATMSLYCVFWIVWEETKFLLIRFGESLCCPYNAIRYGNPEVTNEDAEAFNSMAKNVKGRYDVIVEDAMTFEVADKKYRIIVDEERNQTLERLN